MAEKMQAYWASRFHTVPKTVKCRGRLLRGFSKAFAIGAGAAVACGPVAAETGLLARLSDLEAALSRIETEQTTINNELDRELESIDLFKQRLARCVSDARRTVLSSDPHLVQPIGIICAATNSVEAQICGLEGQIDNLSTELGRSERKSEILSDTLVELLRCLENTD